ncbi:dTMP kinase [Pseudokineococcus sp. 1T1Z-3]|uniref:dTMP kinase n=1 Tax=Pseudokineococcus sp. 1T1Z-3 TaxID=3132745 RepID=UPI00309EAEED
MSAARPAQPVPRGGARPAAPRRGRAGSPGAPEVPAERLALHRPAGVLPAGGAAGALDVLWVASGATAAVVVADSPGTGALALALVLAVRLLTVPLLPAAAAGPRERLATRWGHAARAVSGLLLAALVALPAPALAAWAPPAVVVLVLLAELARPPVPGGTPGGPRRLLALALPALSVALVLGAVGRAVDAVAGVLAAPAPALLAVALAVAALAVRTRPRGTRETPVARPSRDRLSPRALRAVVATARGAARCAALTPVVAAAALAPLHAQGLSAGGAGAALLLLALAGGGLAGAAGVLRWPAASAAPGSVLVLGAGAAGSLVLLAGVVGDLVLVALLLALAAAAAACAVLATGSVDTRPAPDVRAAEAAVLALVAVLAPVLAGVVGTVAFPVGSAGTVVVGGAGVVLLLVGLAAVLTSLLVVRPLSDRLAGPLLPFLLRGPDDGELVGGRPTAARGAAAPPLAGDAVDAHGLPGVLVALEGGERSGKSTQAARLGQALQQEGVDVVLTREPGATPLGAELRRLVLAEGGAAVTPRAEALLYAADRASHVAEVVRPALERGAVVITDRYVDSSLAYQGAGRSLPREEVLALSAWATEGLVPDLVVVLDVDPSTSWQRRRGAGADDRLDAEPDDFHARVRQVFLDLARAGGDRYLVLDAAAPAVEVTAAVVQALSPHLPAPADDRGETERDDDSPTGPVPVVTTERQAGGPGDGEAPTSPQTAVEAGGGTPGPQQPEGEVEGREAEERDAERAAREEAAEQSAARAREREAAEERGRAEQAERERVEAKREQAEREQAERERAELERAEEVRARAEHRRAEERAATSVRSAETAVATARTLGDARVAVAPAPEVGAAVAASPPPPVRLPAERLEQLPEVVRRSAEDVAEAQSAARSEALAQLERSRLEEQRVRRHAAAQAREAERRERERAAREEAEEQERRRAQEMVRREQQEERAEAERRAGARRRAQTERVDVGRLRPLGDDPADDALAEEIFARSAPVGAGARAADDLAVDERTAHEETVDGPTPHEETVDEQVDEETVDEETVDEEAPASGRPPRTAELPVATEDGEDRPALHELQAADRRRQAQQRARRRAAASRRRAEGESASSPVLGGRGPDRASPSSGALADQLFGMQERDGEERPEVEGPAARGSSRHRR